LRMYFVQLRIAILVVDEVLAVSKLNSEKSV
jgi:hypothetical protein